MISNQERPTFGQISMSTATMWSLRSTCGRLKVGCVITSVDHRKVYAVGYNGNASGLTNGCDSAEPGKCGCLHAEENAVISCDVSRSYPKLVYCTHLPCVMCAKRLIQLGGVQRVIYNEEYRSLASLEIFDKVGIQAMRLTDFAIAAP